MSTITLTSTAYSVVSKERVLNTIATAQSNLIKELHDNSFWIFPVNGGYHYITQYALFLDWFNHDNKNKRYDFFSSALNDEKLTNIILEQQLPNGSWQQVNEPNHSTGSLEATISNYMYLKSRGKDVNSTPLKKAREWVLSNGGVAKAPVLARIFLSLFGNYRWSDTPIIPVFTLGDLYVFKLERDVGQWIYPHLLSFAYLRKLEVSKDLGNKYSVSELHVQQRFVNNKNYEPYWGSGANYLIDKMIKIQKKCGSFGGYASSTMFSLAAINHHSQFDDKVEFGPLIKKGFQFIEDRYTSDYVGAVVDGRYWATALSTISLLKSNYPKSDLYKMAQYLADSQNSNGSFCFGLDFNDYPDTDDTAEIVIALNRMPGLKFKTAAKKATEWLLFMQNSDGGFSAFSKNNYSNAIIRYFGREFRQSAMINDTSCADVTGHVLEALGEMGYTFKNSEAVRNAVKFLQSHVQPNGAWDSNWGVNYIYGTSAALVGLLKVEFPKNDPIVVNAINWIMSKQNQDGGWGETTKSYDDAGFAGVGISTYSQTAWALLALIEARLVKTQAVEDGVKYLVEAIENEGQWIDQSPTGTGHPNAMYMFYSAYQYAFPLMSLGALVNLLE